ncbi:nucleotide-binding protein [Deinococcus ruber]|uniref:ExoP n=1 Tax=Deinococcus ruber TaxID=1848197 RepID=A0A918C8Z7_9DEIO|nr:P-loop NTPase [Deinococcus ruber]GGR10705.1 exoP [Deinococcus ruber]
MTMSGPTDLNLSALIATLRRAAVPVLVVGALLAILTYVYSSTRAKVYQATASIAALPGGSANTLINNTLVTAPTLPPSVVARAIRSPEVLQRAVALITSGAADSPQRRNLTTQLDRDLQDGTSNVVTLTADVNTDFIGAYEISAKAATPKLAQLTANSFVDAMLSWDKQRALQTIIRARQNLRSQQAALATGSVRSGLDTQTLTALRVDLAQKLQQISVLEQTVSGTLSGLASATLPLRTVEPKPARNAALVFAAVIFFGVLLAFALDALRRRIQLDDLREFSVPVMGMLPPVRGRLDSAQQLTLQSSQGILREQLDFVRVGLLSTLTHGRVGMLSALAHGTHVPAVVVSSALIGEGKSTVVAGLAANLAAHGQRVLVVDADVFRFQQLQLWMPRNQPRRAPDLQTAEGLQLWPQMIPGVDLAAPTTGSDVAQIAAAIRAASRQYDLVLVDTGPVLKVADTLALAMQMDGLLLVADAETSRVQVQRAFQETARMKVNVLGFVLNRSRESLQHGSYAYNPVQGNALDVP